MIFLLSQPLPGQGSGLEGRLARAPWEGPAYQAGNTGLRSYPPPPGPSSSQGQENTQQPTAPPPSPAPPAFLRPPPPPLPAPGEEECPVLWSAALRALPGHPAPLPLDCLLPCSAAWSQGGAGRGARNMTKEHWLPEMSGGLLALRSHHLVPELSGNPRACACLPREFSTSPASLFWASTH